MALIWIEQSLAPEQLWVAGNVGFGLAHIGLGLVYSKNGIDSLWQQGQWAKAAFLLALPLSLWAGLHRFRFEVVTLCFGLHHAIHESQFDRSASVPFKSAVFMVVLASYMLAAAMVGLWAIAVLKDAWWLFQTFVLAFIVATNVHISWSGEGLAQPERQTMPCPPLFFPCNFYRRGPSRTTHCDECMFAWHHRIDGGLIQSRAQPRIAEPHRNVRFAQGGQPFQPLVRTPQFVGIKTARSSSIIRTAFTMPQATIVQLAPCHNPLIANIISTFRACPNPVR